MKNKKVDNCLTDVCRNLKEGMETRITVTPKIKGLVVFTIQTGMTAIK